MLARVANCEVTATSVAGESGAGIMGLTADPAVIRLAGPEARFHLLVSGTKPDGSSIDLTRSARFMSREPAIASVNAVGVVKSVRDGQTSIRIEAGGHVQDVSDSGQFF